MLRTENALDFDQVHAPGSKILTCSVWPTLLLADEFRPSWMPTPLRYSKHLIGTLPYPDGKGGRPGVLGNLLEDDIIDLLQMGPVTFGGVEGEEQDVGIELTDRQMQHWHEFMNACGHLDGEALWEGELVNVQIKLTGWPMFEEKWAAGPPPHVRLQTQAEMACSGYGMSLIVVGVGRLWPFFNIGIYVYEEPRDEEIIRLLEAAGEEFLEVVEQGLPFKHKERWG